MSRRSLAALLTAGSAVVLAGCASPSPPAAPPAGLGPAGPISVQAADAACDVGAAEAPAGNLTFVVTNTGTKVTEFYLYGAGDRIIGEVGNIGPGLTRQLVVEVPDGGTYTTACRPGMVGTGIRTPFTVTGAATRPIDIKARLGEATADYRRYVVAQVAALVPMTQQFTDAIKARNVDQAKALFPMTRAYYERIEPVTRSFPTLDPKLDGREDDPRDAGVNWTGFHRLEKDLWVDGLKPDTPQVADQLLTDVKDLQTRTTSMQLDPADLATGAKELLDQDVISKIMGEEDRYAHTDLWDIKANVEGSQAAVAALRPVVDAKDPSLGPVLDERFTALTTVLEGFRVGDGFKRYTELTQNDLKTMTDAIDALSEPISKVAGVITS